MYVCMFVCMCILLGYYASIQFFIFQLREPPHCYY